MGRVLMGATMSLDGYIADPSDGVGPLFDWYGNGDVEIAPGDPDRVFRVSAASAEHLRKSWGNIGACVIGRRLFDITNGWHGRPAAGDAVFVVTHEAPKDWPYLDTAPFTFVTDGVPGAIAQAKEFAGERDISVSAGNIGGQALAAGLVDEVQVDLVPVVFGAGVRFFGGYDEGPQLLENPTTVVQGNRVMHLTYAVRRS